MAVSCHPANLSQPSVINHPIAPITSSAPKKYPTRAGSKRDSTPGVESSLLQTIAVCSRVNPNSDIALSSCDLLILICVASRIATRAEYSGQSDPLQVTN